MVLKSTLIINKEFTITIDALLDTGADVNCISEGIIPSKYYSKTTKFITASNK